MLTLPVLKLDLFLNCLLPEHKFHKRTEILRLCLCLQLYLDTSYLPTMNLDAMSRTGPGGTMCSKNILERRNMSSLESSVLQNLLSTE